MWLTGFLIHTINNLAIARPRHTVCHSNTKFIVSVVSLKCTGHNIEVYICINEIECTKAPSIINTNFQNKTTLTLKTNVWSCGMWSKIHNKKWMQRIKQQTLYVVLITYWTEIKKNTRSLKDNKSLYLVINFYMIYWRFFW